MRGASVRLANWKVIANNLPFAAMENKAVLSVVKLNYESKLSEQSGVFQPINGSGFASMWMSSDYKHALSNEAFREVL